MSGEVLTPTEAARLLGVTRWTLARWEGQGVLSAERTLGGHRRYRRAEVEALRDRMGR